MSALRGRSSRVEQRTAAAKIRFKDAADEMEPCRYERAEARTRARGDLALTSVLRLHNLAMSGGLLDAVERMAPEQLEAAQAGYYWLRLDPAADVVAMVQQDMAAGALDDDDRAEALDVRADDEYGQAIPRDQTLVDPSRTRLAEDPDAFTSV